MKTMLLLAVAALATPAFSLAQSPPPAPEKTIPEPFAKGRYARLIARSPFAPASDEAPVAAAEPDFSQNLYVTGVARIGNQDCVFLVSRGADQAKFALFGREPHDGITLESIEWSPIVGKSRVVLRKNGQIGTVSYDEMLVRAAIPQPAQVNNDADTPRPGLFPRPPGQNFNRPQTGQGPNGNFQRRRTRIVPGGGPQ